MRDVKFAKVLVFVNALVPLALIVRDAAHDQLGANPLEFILRSTGTLALIFLTLSLAVTPARKLLGMPWLIKLRRMLGLFCFFYACLHVSLYLTFDQFFDVREIVADVLSRPFIAFGMVTFVILVRLAWTSTDAAVRRLGGKRWQRLHRWVYVAAGAAVLHYWLEVKLDRARPLLFGGVLAALLAYRLVTRTRRGLLERVPLRAVDGQAGARDPGRPG